MPTPGFEARRGRVAAYFDETALEAWARLTSDAPVSRIRETVRQGRAEMRATLLDWLGADLSGQRLLDAGCGPGPLAIEAAARGADVVGVDVSPNLIAVAQRRAASSDLPADRRPRFAAADMSAPGMGRFDAAACMDVLIHYRADDAVAALSALAERVERRVVFTFAPRTPALSVMHAAGRLFPRGDRAPSIEPTPLGRMVDLIGAAPALSTWRVGRTRRVTRGFYTSQALELVRP